MTTTRLMATIRRLPIKAFAAGLLIGSSLLTVSTATAQQPARLDRAMGIMPDSMRLKGAEVDSIKNVENISDWQTLDMKHLTLKINNAQRYLLTLDDQCVHLRGARLVGVSMTNQEIWADFDHVAADGWECRIDTITRLGRSRS